MAMSIVSSLPTAAEISREFPVTEDHQIQSRREEVQRVLDGSDPRRLMIIGPCSAWPSEAVVEYAERLARVQERVREHLNLVLRVYIQKPRTTVGWPGPLNEPEPGEGVNIVKGIRQCRELMCAVGRQLPLADEMLFTHHEPHFDPLLSYTALGARSAEDMEHRYIASGIDSAVGVKNPTSGDIATGVNGVQSVQSPHVFNFQGNQVQTSGNKHAHLILRGGATGPNYNPQSIAHAHRLLTDPKRNIQNPAIIVDTSHDNSLNGKGKDPRLQRGVVRDILTGIEEQREEYAIVRGWMVESFLMEGKQSVSDSMDRTGLSITDPCLGWEKTERLLLETADLLDNAHG